MNPLQQLQEDVQAMLLGHPDLKVVPFSIYRKQVIEAAQDEAAAAWKIRVAGQVGLASLVMMPSLRVVTPNVPGPQYDITQLIRTFQDPRVNNTGLSAEDVSLSILTWLDGQIFGGVTQLHGNDREDALHPNYDYPGFLVYDTVLVGPLPQDIVGRTAAPAMSVAPGTGVVTLSCADGVAAIYYTTDGTAPMPPANDAENANSSVQLYAAPFQSAAGVTVKALAWNRLMMPSDIQQGVVS